MSKLLIALLAAAAACLSADVGWAQSAGPVALIKAPIAYYGRDAEMRIADGSRTVPMDKVFFGHDVGAGVVYQDANIKVTAVENAHFHFHPDSPAYGKYKSYSYRVETPDRVI